jgi:hypothetical protein
MSDEKEMENKDRSQRGEEQRSRGAEDKPVTFRVALVCNRPRCGASGGGEVVSG